MSKHPLIGNQCVEGDVAVFAVAGQVASCSTCRLLKIVNGVGSAGEASELVRVALHAYAGDPLAVEVEADRPGRLPV